MSNIYGKAFNNCLEEYLLFILNLFPNSVDIRSAYNGLLNIFKGSTNNTLSQIISLFFKK